MTTNTKTTTTAARELARELRDNNGSMRTVYNIAATLDALADENARLTKLNSQHITDLVDTDALVHASCARVLPQAAIDGDSYAVPGVAELCEMVVAKCLTLANENAALIAEVRRLQAENASLTALLE